MQSGLAFRPGKMNELEASLVALSSRLEGFQLALEYISDYVKISGLSLWRTEFANVVNFFVEQVRAT